MGALVPLIPGRYAWCNARMCNGWTSNLLAAGQSSSAVSPQVHSWYSRSSSSGGIGGTGSGVGGRGEVPPLRSGESTLIGQAGKTEYEVNIFKSSRYLKLCYILALVWSKMRYLTYGEDKHRENDRYILVTTNIRRHVIWA